MLDSVFGQAFNDIENFQNQNAASGSALDPAQAISSEDPSLFWLAISIVGAAADIGGAAAAFRAIRVDIRAARSIEQLEVVVRREAQAVCVRAVWDGWNDARGLHSTNYVLCTATYDIQH